MSDDEIDIENSKFIYCDSSSEVEEWVEDQEWVVNDITGEYHPPRGPRYLKFDWDQWKRPDGTSHTWEREGSVATQDARRTVKAFDDRRSWEEGAAAKDPFISPYYPYQIPADESDEDSESVNEDVDMTKKKKPKKPKFVYLFTEIPQQAHELFVDAKLRLLNRRQAGLSEVLPIAENMFSELREERQTSLDELNISIYEAVQDNLYGLGRAVLPSDANRTRVRTQNDMQQRMSSLKIKEISLPFQKNVPSSNIQRPSPAASAGVAATSSKVITTQPVRTLRQSLQAIWAARLSGAARITLSNVVNDEDIPPIDINIFQYLERTYLYEYGVSRPDPDFFHSCECPAGACRPETCACQADSMIFDADDNKAFVYDSSGLYAFDRIVNSYVFECNEKCSCGPNCPSRVAQKPRKIPIDIFRTVECGWGVRSPVDIPKGTVLGLYTGILVERMTAREIPAEDARYLLDLDFHEDVIGNETGYTVNAHTSGNWTRFVNHSCDPLCILYAVIYDSVPQLHQPKIALVAKKNILAFTEITLDYSPNASKKGKGKQKVTEGTLECRCGTEQCRGYIY